MQIPIQKTNVDSRAKKTNAKKLKGSLKTPFYLTTSLESRKSKFLKTFITNIWTYW